MKSSIWLLLLFPMFGAPARGESQDTFRLFASAEILGDRLPSPTDRKRSINESLGGNVSSGMAYTSGTARLTLENCEDCLRIKACFDLTTSARTVTKKQVRSDIQVTVFATATTETAGTKLVIVRPNGVDTEPAVASSRTAMTLHGVSAHATGSFAGEKERQAEIVARQAALESFPEKEPGIAEEVRADAVKNIDEKAGKMIESFNRDYKEIFYRPVFIDERVPGKLHYRSTPQAIYVNIRTPDGAEWERVPAAPEVGADTQVGITVHQSLLNSKAVHELGGKVHNEQTFQDYLTHQGLREHARDWGGPDEQIFVRFCAKAPLHFEFEPDGVRLTLCAESLTSKEVRYPGTLLSLRYLLRGPDKKHLMKLRLQGAVQAMAAKHGESLPPELLARFQERYGSLFPKELVFGELSLPLFSDAFVLGRAAFVDGWLTLEWKGRTE